MSADTDVKGETSKAVFTPAVMPTLLYSQAEMLSL